MERLAALLEALVTPPAAPPPSPAPIAPATPNVRPAAHSVVRARPSGVPLPLEGERTERLAAGILSKLGSLYLSRGRTLHWPLASWREFRMMDRQLRDAVHALRWVGEAVTRPARALLAASEGPAEVFAGALALIHLGGDGDIAPFLSGPAALADVGDGVFAALRLGGEASPWQEIVARAPAATPTTADSLSALADRGQLSADTLLELLDHASDAVAVRAAELLAWLGRPPTDTRIVEHHLRRGVAEARVCAFLLAAVALGSTSALDEVRKRMDAGAPLTEHAIDALACAGAARDAERLLTLASRNEALAPWALLAAGHLGEPGRAVAFAAELEPKAVAERALQMIVGSSIGKKRTSPKGVRLLHGDVWSLPGALTRLGSPEELVRVRRWLALEVAVRSGAKAPVVFDVSAPVAVQESALARLRGAIEPRGRSIPDGAWFYFGRPIS